MDARRNYTPMELKKASDNRKIKAIYSRILELRARFQRLKDWGFTDHFHYQCIHIQLELYSWDLEKLDPVFFAENVASLPDL